ncbi:MAG: hypothetical protein QNJ69_02045 [Gammaproteobacteria bacterium]|nr:hypothetical protein [Gammaproteobacteria bacterium]
MKHSYTDNDIRLNAHGEIDLEYYRNKAEELRAHYLAEMSANAKRKIKDGLVEFYQRYICLKCQPTH